MVYAKIDWFSVMVHNRSIKWILEKLQFDYALYFDMLNNVYERSQGFKSVMVLSIHGVTLELKYDDYISTEQELLFEKDFAKIRVDITGQGLDYLRSKFDVDKSFTDKMFWQLSDEDVDYKITRCDFAFDFVNHADGFVDKLINYLHDFEREFDLYHAGDIRLPVGRKGGINYSYRCGDQKTVYLGSPRGDKLLRIYDKKMQLCKRGVWTKPVPEAFTKNDGEINSWFRIEFQCRRKCADAFLFSVDGNLNHVLRAVFDDYLIRDKKTGKPVDFMVDLYDWEKLPPIIQNQNFI